jgi:hypothetical protein
VLSKTYPKATEDIRGALEELAVARTPVPSPPTVVRIPGVGRTMVKVRVASSDMGRGRSGGYRVILDHCEGDEWVAVVAYAKVARQNISPRDILDAVRREESS